MWLSFLFFFVVLFALAGGVLLGGVFTLVLVPLGILAGVGAITYAIWGRASSANATTDDGVINEPLPHSAHQNTASAPATPGELLDARQQQQ